MLRSMTMKILGSLILMTLLLGCGGGGDGDGNGGGGGDAPTVDLNCNVADVDYRGDVVLSWSSANADGCTASGAWSGDKSADGSETITGLTADCSFILTCTDSAGRSANDTVTVTVGPSGPGSASLNWIAPTTNTDSTPLTDLAGYIIHYGPDAGNYDHTIDVRLGDSALNDLGNGRIGFVVDGLAAGTWHFAVKAIDTSLNESGFSNTASKEISAP